MTGTGRDVSVALPSRRGFVAVVALLAIAGCTPAMPPRLVAEDRMSYGEVIAESWKRQALLNVVRLRYADTPVFLEVASVINSHSVAGRGNVGGGVNTDAGLGNMFTIGAEGSWSNTPTVTYQPLSGEHLSRSLLQPVPAAAVFQLLQGGWSADFVLTTVAMSLNGIRNDIGGIGEDPEFRRLVDALSRIQHAGALGVRIESRKGENAVVVVLRQGDPSTGVNEDLRLVRNLLRLEEGVAELEISSDFLPRTGREVAMVSRSMLEILLKLGEGVELPAVDVEDGRVSPARPQKGERKNPAMARIRSSIAMPTDTYAAVPYKGHWYWIDDKDYASKRVFTFLLILFSLAETNRAVASPMVTVPSR